MRVDAPESAPFVILTLRLPVETHAKLKAIAERNERTLAAESRFVLTAHVGEHAAAA